MIRKARRPLTFVAILFAVGAVGTVARAGEEDTGFLHSDGEFKMDGFEEETEIPRNALTLFGKAVRCEEGTFEVEGVGGGQIEENEVNVTVWPTYKKCTYGELGLPATVNGSGCDYVLHVGKTIESHRYAVTMDLACPAEKYFEVTVYLTPAKHTEKKEVWCTFTIAAQTGKTGAFFEDLTDGTITLNGAFEGLVAKKSGVCGEGEDKEAERELAVLFTGRSVGGEETDVNIEE